MKYRVYDQTGHCGYFRCLFGAALPKDSDLAPRCRKAAEDVLSLEAGTASYARLYHHLNYGNR
jgi:hypothetical protein